MAKTQHSESPLEIFARRISDSISDAFSDVSVSDEQPITAFPPESSDYVYVLNSARGLPVRMGVVSGDAGKREINRLQKEAQSLADAGMIRSFKYLNLASDRLASAVGRWISDLIGLALSGAEAGDGGEESDEQTAAQPAAKRRGRPPGSGKKRRGRPRKAAAVATEGGEGETPKKRRGRPPGSGKKSGAKRGPGRPRKSAVVSAEGTETEAPKKRRGRPPGSGKKGGATKGAKRGRPRKGTTPADTSATPSETSTASTAKRRGRPPGSARKGAAKKSGAKRGRKPGKSVAAENSNSSAAAE